MKMIETITAWPTAELEFLGKCPVCGSAERDLRFHGLTDRAFGIADGAWDLYRCRACASGYVDPRPSPDSISKAYGGYYTHTVEDHPIIRRKGRVRRLLHDLLNGYENAVYGVKRQPSLSLGRWVLPLLPSLRSAADSECRHLPSSFAGGKLLDVGCGNGAFLSLAQQAGWQVEGVDFDSSAVQAARSRGLDVHHGGVEVLGDKRSYYDVITISHVIEHVHDPVMVLSALYDLLKPGGVLWLDTPNFESLGASVFGPAWRGLEIPRHLHIFSRRALTQALRNAGFKSLRQRWRGMSSFDVYAASEAIAKTSACASASYQGRPPFHACMAELWEMVRPARREFLTYTARK